MTPILRLFLPWSGLCTFWVSWDCCQHISSGYCIAAQLSGVSATPQSFVLLAESTFCLILEIIHGDNEEELTLYFPWDMLLVTSLQADFTPHTLSIESVFSPTHCPPPAHLSTTCLWGCYERVWSVLTLLLTLGNGVVIILTRIPK